MRQAMGGAIVKAFILLSVASLAIACSNGFAFAQYGDAVPIQPNHRGEPSCPSNYIIKGNACVSLYPGGGTYDGSNRPERYADNDEPPLTSENNAPHVVQPWLRPDGQLQCPSNYVISRGLCVSIDGIPGYSAGSADVGYGRGGDNREGVEPRWNSSGSAVCPEGYDYHARSGLCLPQRY